ncbi:MAG TPA: FAD binding domain-containing protein [Kiritimatiellia bacterium]|nr:FAD binding domain-containing protein [Kiritimatiellia bacterium]
MSAVGSKLEGARMMYPGTLVEALGLLENEGTRGILLAGGTDLMVQWEAGVRAAPERIIDLSGVGELKEIRAVGDRLFIGAGVTHRMLRESAVIQRGFPALAAAAATVGGRQIQAMGTLGGSLANASPAGDIAPSLLVADTKVVVASAKGERTVGLEAFLIDYRKIDLRDGELIVGVEVATLKEGEKEQWRKLGPRAAQAISKVMGTYRGKYEGGRVVSFAVALGSVAPKAIRLPDVEAFVVGREIDRKTLEEAEALTSSLVKPISDIRSTASYRSWVSGRLVRGFLEHLRE